MLHATACQTNFTWEVCGTVLAAQNQASDHLSLSQQISPAASNQWNSVTWKTTQGGLIIFTVFVHQVLQSKEMLRGKSSTHLGEQTKLMRNDAEGHGKIILKPTQNEKLYNKRRREGSAPLTTLSCFVQSSPSELLQYIGRWPITMIQGRLVRFSNDAAS